jgi:hypothetical protein
MSKEEKRASKSSQEQQQYHHHHHPLSLIIAEMDVPQIFETHLSSGEAASSLNISEFDSAISSLCSRLPLGTVVMLASQGSDRRFGAGIRHSIGKLSDVEIIKTGEAQVGCFFLHVCNR